MRPLDLVPRKMRWREKRHARKVRTQAPKREPFTHDYTGFRGWGHDVVIHTIEGAVIKGSLWSGHRLREGDYLLLERKEKLYRYRVTEARAAMDPDDMYHFTAVFDQPPKENR